MLHQTPILGMLSGACRSIFALAQPQRGDEAMILVTLVGALLFTLWLLHKRHERKMQKKQGAYGAVPVHRHSIAEQLMHPEEVGCVIAMLLTNKLLFGNKISTKLSTSLWKHLDQTSRSFAGVIRILPAPLLADAVCVFYLLLRALDTVEDEMDLQKFAEFCQPWESPQQAKIRLLRDFHTILDEANGTSNAFPLNQLLNSTIGSAAEKVLLHSLPELIDGFRGVKEQQVIKEIVREMGEGMAEYCVRDMRYGTTDMRDYDRYCHIVAGLVGRGLTELFCNLGYEDETLVSDMSAWNSMGLFLQRTNITRDICEDAAEGRSWWPQTMWRTGHSYNYDLAQLRDVTILNKMVANALELIPESARYLDQLKNPSIFRFCALPQVMAIATLAECYNNPNVFTGVVKIRKGHSAKLAFSIMNMKTAASARRKFRLLAAELIDSIRSSAVHVGDAETAASCQRALEALGHADWSKTLRKQTLQTPTSHILLTYIFTLCLVIVLKLTEVRCIGFRSLCGGLVCFPLILTILAQSIYSGQTALRSTSAVTADE